jgi:hypothetical protein
MLRPWLNDRRSSRPRHRRHSRTEPTTPTHRAPIEPDHSHQASRQHDQQQPQPDATAGPDAPGSPVQAGDCPQRRNPPWRWSVHGSGPCGRERRQLERWRSGHAVDRRCRLPQRARPDEGCASSTPHSRPCRNGLSPGGPEGPWGEHRNLPITSRMLGVDPGGTRRIQPAHVGCLVSPDGSRRIQKDRVDDHRDDQARSIRSKVPWSGPSAEGLASATSTGQAHGQIEEPRLMVR